jgi:hypothetical protein
MNRSNFCAVGTQKSATTWLFEVLNEHPEVFVPQEKELHFHCPENKCRHSTRGKGRKWYDSQFDDAPPAARAIGEMTTNYMYFPESAEWLHRQNPDLKIIMLLRHPVDRAYSAYWMWKRHTPTLPSFDEIAQREDSTMIQRGYYIDQIERYQGLFGKRNIGVWFQEDIKSDPAKVLREIFSFINVDPDFTPSVLNQKVGETKKLPGAAGFVFYKILSPAINAPGIRSIWRFMRRTTNIKQYLNKLLRQDGESGNYPALDPETRSRWIEHYRPWNERLFEALGRRMDNWYS